MLGLRISKIMHGVGKSTTSTPLSAYLVLALIAAFATSFLLSTVAVIRTVSLQYYVLTQDFKAYFTAAVMMKHGVAGQLYNVTQQWYWQQHAIPDIANSFGLAAYINPPVLALLLGPLGYLSYYEAYGAWFFCNLGIVALIVCFVCRILKGLPGYVVLGSVALTLSFWPLWVSLTSGQVSMLLLLSLLAGFYWLEQGRDKKAGVWLAILLIKPQFVMIPIILLFLQKRFVALKGFLVTSLILASISVALVGMQGIGEYLQILTSLVAEGSGYGEQIKSMQTVKSALHLAFNTSRVSDIFVYWVIGSCIALALFLISIYHRNPDKYDQSLQWAMATMLLFIITPHANYHDLNLLAAANIFLIAYAFRGKRSRTQKYSVLLLVALSFLAVTFTRFVAMHIPVQLSVVYVVVGFLYLCFMMLHGKVKVWNIF